MNFDKQTLYFDARKNVFRIPSCFFLPRDAKGFQRKKMSNEKLNSLSIELRQLDVASSARFKQFKMS